MEDKTYKTLKEEINSAFSDEYIQCGPVNSSNGRKVF